MHPTPDIEQHPLLPFLPTEARILMLGSFPPPQKRWSMNFFYPNLQNDMWRIMGHLFFDNQNHFVDTAERRFRQPEIEQFCTNHGIALYDAASAVRRLQGNASDKFLEVVLPTDIASLLEKLPRCQAIVTTGQKATDILRTQFNVDEPKVGTYTSFIHEGRPLRFYRMPSSSRAYPLALSKKAAFYHTMMTEVGMLPNNR
ncbi:MAG: uracil-DNA glycosylase family protein [Bacteroidaceae bacterium]|nr:uracil-DNA glycosylase family protein [Bacteroidaceae bacterium]